MESLILIKLGGSLITDKSKPYTARIDVIQRLGQEIKAAQKKYKGKIIIGHGQGSYAHIPASKYQTHLGIVDKDNILGFAEVSEMAKRPNTILTQEFVKLGIPVVSFSPMSFEFTKNKKLKKIMVEPIKRALELGMIPVFYGDVILDESEKGFCIYSTEATLDILAKRLSKLYKIEKIIMAGDTNGVYDNQGKTIAEINSKNFKVVKKYLTGSKNTDVTGGSYIKCNNLLI